MGKKIEDILHGEEGSFLVMLGWVLMILSLVTVVVATVTAGASASQGSSATWRVADPQHSNTSNTGVYDAAQSATGSSQLQQAGSLAEAAMAGQTIASPASSNAPSSPSSLDMGMSLGELMGTNGDPEVIAVVDAVAPGNNTSSGPGTGSSATSVSQQSWTDRFWGAVNALGEDVGEIFGGETSSSELEGVGGSSPGDSSGGSSGGGCSGY